MFRTKLSKMVVSGLLLATLVSAALAFGGLYWMSRAFDDRSVRGEQALVQAALDGFVQSLRVSTADHAWSDRAFAALQARNSQSVYEGLGTTTTYGDTFDRLVILDPQGSAIYGWADATGAEVNRSAIPADVARRMAADLATHPFEPTLAIDQWHIIDGEIYAVSAARSSPYNLGDLDPADLPILVTANRLDDEAIADFSDSTLIQGIVYRPHMRVGPNRTSLPIGPPDAPLGLICWPLAEPGTAIARQLGPGYLTMALMLALAALAVGRIVARQANQVDGERKRAWAAARTDTLTQLLNREGFTDLQNHALIAKNLKIGAAHMVYLDLNRFKVLNDGAGHEVGDAALRLMAQRMRDAASGFARLARVGGDEFVALFVGPDSKGQADRFCGALQASASVPAQLGEAFHIVHASIGVAEGRRGDHLDDLMGRADAAMYWAKANGLASAVAYTETMGAERAERRRIEQALRRALVDPDAHGLTLMYQPIIATDGDDGPSAEVLVRWTDPELGTVSPGTFIPVAEAANLIVPLGTFVMDRALRTMAQWPELRLSVNVSAIQLIDQTFADTLLDQIFTHAVNCERMTIEITETALIELPELAQLRIEALRAAGFRFSLDDFGTGYASISYLEQFPFDELKIDGSYVDRLIHPTRGEEAQRVFLAIAHLGNALGLEVVAEGIETQAQHDQARAAGCAHLQGYLFAKPMRLAQLRAFFAQAAAPNITPLHATPPLRLPA